MTSRLVLAAALTAAIAGALLAQNGVQRTVVTRADISVPGREAVTIAIEIAPGASTGRHTHAGDEIDYVVEGQLEVTMDGQAPRILKPGESIIMPQGTAHKGGNRGTEPVKAVGVYVVEKGKPITTAAQ